MELSEAGQSALREAGVATVYLHGSRVRGTARPDSDADVAVLLRPGAGVLPLLRREDLAARLAADLDGADVDLTVLDEAPLELRARVIREGVVVFRDDEPRRVAFEVDTQSRWFDVEPWHTLQTQRYLERVAAEGLDG